MKFNLFALGRAIRALIITVVGICLVGMIIFPELVGYSPENPALLAGQRDFAIAALCVGILAGCLFYWDCVKND
jgi:hypothetical protein